MAPEQRHYIAAILAAGMMASREDGGRDPKEAIKCYKGCYGGLEKLLAGGLENLPRTTDDPVMGQWREE